MVVLQHYHKNDKLEKGLQHSHEMLVILLFYVTMFNKFVLSGIGTDVDFFF